MAEQTTGEQEQERAFEESLKVIIKSDTVWNPGLSLDQLAALFAAGVRYGLELRGCCQERERER